MLYKPTGNKPLMLMYTLSKTEYGVHFSNPPVTMAVINCLCTLNVLVSFVFSRLSSECIASVPENLKTSCLHVENKKCSESYELNQLKSHLIQLTLLNTMRLINLKLLQLQMPRQMKTGTTTKIKLPQIKIYMILI